MRIISSGPDGEEHTQWDLGVTINPKKADKFVEGTWLYEERKRQGMLEEAADAGGSKLSVTYTAGGGVTLEGAAYFWFFTRLIKESGELSKAEPVLSHKSTSNKSSQRSKPQSATCT